MDTANLLEITDLGCIRQQSALFAGLSFNLARGELLLVKGDNGTGKSSLLRMLTGLSSAHAGDIKWHQQSINTILLHYAEQLHYLGHANGLKLGLTVAENIALFQLGRQSNLEDIKTPLQALQLTQHLHKQVRQLSAGQQRKLALLRLFICEKPLWILDEPLTALDAATQQWFLSQLQNHLQQGGMCVLSSHQDIVINNVVTKNVRLSAC